MLDMLILAVGAAIFLGAFFMVMRGGGDPEKRTHPASGS